MITDAQSARECRARSGSTSRLLACTSPGYIDLMRTARLLAVIGTILTVGLSGGLLLAPPASAQPPFRLADYVTDNAGILSDSGRAAVTSAVDKLYTDRHIRLWVVYVDNFSGQSAVNWAKRTVRTSDLGDR